MIPAWLREAACGGMDGHNGRPDFLRLDTVDQCRICAHCPVRAACLADAIAHGDTCYVRGGVPIGKRPLMWETGGRDD